MWLRPARALIKAEVAEEAKQTETKKVVHQAAKRAGLFSQSSGEGADRFLQVFRRDSMPAGAAAGMDLSSTAIS